MPRTLAEIMTREVLTMDAGQPLIDAMTFMRSQKVRHIPVMDEGRLVGIVTDRDVKRATPTALAEGQRVVWDQVVNETPLSKAMTADPITAAPSTSLRGAVALFVEHKVGCLPVVNNGELVGIVAAGDLFAAILEELPADDA